MAGSRAVEAAVGAPKHHRIRNVIIVVAVLALISRDRRHHMHYLLTG